MQHQQEVIEQEVRKHNKQKRASEQQRESSIINDIAAISMT